MRNAQTFQRMETPPLRMGDAPFVDGNATFAGGGHAFCGWKRRCADVRAGTQAPPLPFLVWLHVPRLPARCSPMDKIKNDCWRGARPWTKREKVAGEQFADGLNRKRLLANSSPID